MAVFRGIRGLFTEQLPDIKLNKNLVSGIYGSSTELVKFLRDKKSGIKTLIFIGVNTDQCVYATIQDTNLKGCATVLLKNGCGTISPQYASKMSSQNCGCSWGVVSSREQLAYGVDHRM
jgi:nicotinamidase-related amidase